ncbi:putative LigA [Streptomyces misionensis JCM 4497]
MVTPCLSGRLLRRRRTGPGRGAPGPRGTGRVRRPAGEVAHPDPRRRLRPRRRALRLPPGRPGPHGTPVPRRHGSHHRLTVAGPPVRRPRPGHRPGIDHLLRQHEHQSHPAEYARAGLRPAGHGSDRRHRPARRRGHRPRPSPRRRLQRGPAPVRQLVELADRRPAGAPRHMCADVRRPVRRADRRIHRGRGPLRARLGGGGLHRHQHGRQPGRPVPGARAARGGRGRRGQGGTGPRRPLTRLSVRHLRRRSARRRFVRPAHLGAVHRLLRLGVPGRARDAVRAAGRLQMGSDGREPADRLRLGREGLGAVPVQRPGDGRRRGPGDQPGPVGHGPAGDPAGRPSARPPPPRLRAAARAGRERGGERALARSGEGLDAARHLQPAARRPGAEPAQPGPAGRRRQGPGGARGAGADRAPALPRHGAGHPPPARLGGLAEHGRQADRLLRVRQRREPARLAHGGRNALLVGRHVRGRPVQRRLLAHRGPVPAAGYHRLPAGAGERGGRRLGRGQAGRELGGRRDGRGAGRGRATPQGPPVDAGREEVVVLPGRHGGLPGRGNHLYRRDGRGDDGREPEPGGRGRRPVHGGRQGRAGRLPLVGHAHRRRLGAHRRARRLCLPRRRDGAGAARRPGRQLEFHQHGRLPHRPEPQVPDDVRRSRHRPGERLVRLSAHAGRERRTDTGPGGAARLADRARQHRRPAGRLGAPARVHRGELLVRRNGRNAHRERSVFGDDQREGRRHGSDRGERSDADAHGSDPDLAAAGRRGDLRAGHGRLGRHRPLPDPHLRRPQGHGRGESADHRQAGLTAPRTNRLRDAVTAPTKASLSASGSASSDR